MIPMNTKLFAGFLCVVTVALTGAVRGSGPWG